MVVRILHERPPLVGIFEVDEVQFLDQFNNAEKQ